jgi:predicted TIM-barrel fold metal-dependent hydrolase
MRLSRRRFLKTTFATTAACGLPQIGVANSDAAANQIVDTHVYLGHWPHQRLTSEDPAQLIDDLRRNNIAQAWLSSFDGLFHKDIAAVNQRLADVCSRPSNEALVPFGCVNPMLPDWEEDVRRCHEVFHTPGIRLHPNYHGYTLDHPRFNRLLELSADRGLIVQLVAGLDDQKHFLLSPPSMQVDLSPLPEKIAAHKKLRLVLANGYRSTSETSFRALAKSSRVCFDAGRITEPKDIVAITSMVATNRVVFGSGTPLNSIEHGLSKLAELKLSSADRRAIASENANALIRGIENRGRQ